MGIFRKGTVMAKKKKSEKPPEDKRKKFLRVVAPRVRKAMKAISLIGNQAGSAYEYTSEDVAHIINALRTAVDGVETAYTSKGKVSVEFTFTEKG